MAKIKIDKEKCKACGLCIMYCPRKLVEVSDKINKRGVKPARFKKNAEKECAGCAFCAIVCPDNAIEVHK